MKASIILALLLATMAAWAAEIEIELITGSKFNATLVKATPGIVIVQTAIGELRLTRQMLSPACRVAIARTAAGDSPAPGATASTNAPAGTRPKVDIKLTFREKTLDIDNENARHVHKETRQKAGELDISFGYIPLNKTYAGRVDYVFTGEGQSAAMKGKLIEFDKGSKTFELKGNDKDPHVVIQSRQVNSVDARAGGATLREAGIALKGYSVKVYLDNQLVFEEKK